MNCLPKSYNLFGSGNSLLAKISKSDVSNTRRSDERLAETGRYRDHWKVAPTAKLDLAMPVTLSRDSQLLLNLKEGLDEIGHGPYRNAAAEKDVFLKFSPVSLEETDSSDGERELQGDSDGFFPPKVVSEFSEAAKCTQTENCFTTYITAGYRNAKSVAELDGRKEFRSHKSAGESTNTAVCDQHKAACLKDSRADQKESEESTPRKNSRKMTNKTKPKAGIAPSTQVHQCLLSTNEAQTRKYLRKGGSLPQLGRTELGCRVHAHSDTAESRAARAIFIANKGAPGLVTCPIQQFGSVGDPNERTNEPTPPRNVDGTASIKGRHMGLQSNDMGIEASREKQILDLSGSEEEEDLDRQRGRYFNIV